MNNVTTMSVWVIMLLVLGAIVFVGFCSAILKAIGILFCLALGVAGFAGMCFLLNVFFVAKGEEYIQETFERKKQEARKVNSKRNARRSVK